MRALQEAMATSRVEIVASHADNQELRRTNEELRRELQQVGERMVDERAPPIPIRARPMSRYRSRLLARKSHSWE